MFMSLWLSAAGDGPPSLWQQLWEQHWWSLVDFSAMSVMHILSSRRIMLSLCLRSGSGCKWDVQQMEVFNGLRVIQTIFSLASKKKPRTVAWPLRRVQEHPVHGLETGRNPLTVPVEKRVWFCLNAVSLALCLQLRLADFIPFIPATKSVTFPHGLLMPSLMRLFTRCCLFWILCYTKQTQTGDAEYEIRTTFWQRSHTVW